jgi:hypothetical protein
MIKLNISTKKRRNTKIELFPGARLQNNKIIQLLKVSKSCDAKIELVAGARPPDATLTS